jgi:EmrB/QacA subfamily drug resistance transporter
MNAPSAPAPFVRLASAKGRWIIAATAMGSGMVFLDGSVVNVALPRIQTDLGVPLSGLQWIVDAYALFLAALLLVGGAVGDAYGRKRAFLVGLTVFTLSSVACGLAPNAGVLIAARAVQGVGGAFLVPGSLAMIKATIAPQDSGRAIGLWAGLSGATTAIGPLVGGYFVAAVTWRLIFFINVPLALVTLYAAVVHVPETRDTRASKRLDWLGATATVLGLGGVTFGLIQGPVNGWTSPLVLAALMGGSLALAIFPFLELRASHPMVPLNLFRSSNFTGCNIATLGVYFSFSGLFLFLVLKLQQVESYSPFEAGAALLPVTLLLLVLSPRVGGLIGRFGARLLMTLGASIIALSFLLISLPGRSESYWTVLLPPILVLAIGMCLFITPLTTTVMGAVPPDTVGVASGINNAVSRVAGLLAVAVLGVVVVTAFQSSLQGKLDGMGLTARARSSLISNATRLAEDPIPRGLSPNQRRAVHNAIKDSYVDGFRWAMLTCMVLCALSAVVSALMIGPDPVSVSSLETADAAVQAAT